MPSRYMPRALGGPILRPSTSFTPTVSIKFVVPTPAYRGTGGILPIARPVLPYSVNGIALDPPLVCTAPMGSTSVLVPAGSTFVLTFANPSAQTQSMLSNYPTATMVFALYTGEQVTGPVGITTITGATIWQVTCTTLAPIQVQRWRVQSQFS